MHYHRLVPSYVISSNIMLLSAVMIFGLLPGCLPISADPCPENFSERELRGVDAALTLVNGNDGGGDPSEPKVIVRQLIYNSTSHRLWVARSPTFEANCVRLLSPGGEQLDLSASGQKAASYSIRRGHSSSRIEPRGTLEKRIDLSSYFDLTEPGVYVVRYSTKYAVLNDTTTEYWTQPEPLKFEVLTNGDVKPLPPSEAIKPASSE